MEKYTRKNNQFNPMSKEEFMKKEIERQREIEGNKVFKKFRVKVYEQKKSGGYPFADFETDNFYEAVLFAKKMMAQQKNYRADSEYLWVSIDEFQPIHERSNVIYPYRTMVHFGENDVMESNFANGGGVGQVEHFTLDKDKLNQDAKWYADRIKSGQMSTTKKSIEERIEEYKKDLFLLEIGRKKPSNIIGTGYKGNAKKMANTWLLQEIYKDTKILELIGDNYSNGGGVGLKGNQSRIDMNHNGNIDAEDFKLLRSSMNGAWRNDHEHVNSTSRKNGKVIDYEVRYARKHNPSRKGYKGKSNFEDGGYMDLSKIKANVVNESNAEDTALVPEIDIENVQKLNLNITNNQIKSEDDAVRILKQLFDKNSINSYEEVKVLFLDNSNVVIGVYNHSKGGITGTIVDIEMICALAVKCLAKGVIMCHNHPSGKLQFSEADITTSKNLKNALKLFSIVMMDSIVITENGFISMSSQGIFLRGGAFERLSNSVAKRYEGDAVAPKYQRMYGKRYDKEEAKEVGNKVAGKVKAMQMQNKKAFGGLFGKNIPSISKPHYPNFEDKQVMLKNGEWVQVLDQSGDTLMVISLGQIGTGASAKRVNISEVEMN